MTRQEELFSAATEATHGNWKHSVLFGVSNSAKVIDQGVLLGVSNLETVAEKHEGAIFNCVFKFPPNDEVFFAIYVKDDLATLRRRLNEMLGAHATRPNEYADENRKTRLYLASDGLLYLWNKGYLNSVDETRRQEGQPGIRIDRIEYAIYPPGKSVHRTVLANEFVAHLANLVGNEKCHRIHPFDRELGAPEIRAALPAALPCRKLR
jgi:5-methylcytosine-specific restriction enzyme B